MVTTTPMPNRTLRRQFRTSLDNENVIPITYCGMDNVWVFYTKQGRLVQSATQEEAKAKWLLTKEND